jgi:hypothetical protein
MNSGRKLKSQLDNRSNRRTTLKFRFLFQFIHSFQFIQLIFFVGAEQFMRCCIRLIAIVTEDKQNVNDVVMTNIIFQIAENENSTAINTSTSEQF